MNRRILTVLSGMALAGALAIPARAQETTPPATPPVKQSTRTPGINQRQVNQRERIHQGVRSGELTSSERQQLNAEEKQIQADKTAAKSDGTVTKIERKELHQELNQTSKDIYTGKHNDVKNNSTPGIDKREANQRARIRQGVQSGELTRPETARLRAEQKDIRQDEKTAKSDGKVTTAERRHIQHDQNVASRDIYRQKHDAQKRPKARH